MKLSRLIPKSFAAQLIVVLLVACAARAAFYAPARYEDLDDVGVDDAGSDPRFLLQAKYLNQGKGYLHRDETPCTSLPPGYPAAIAVGLGITTSLKALIVIQLVLSIASCVLIFLALRRFNEPAAFVCGVVFAAHPWVAGFATRFMSESGGVFWSALAIWLIAKSHHNGHSLPRAIGIGFCAMALCLNSPGAAPLAALVWFWLFFASTKTIKHKVGLAIGSCLLFVPWQAWCVHVNGKPAPMLITKLEYAGVGPWEWMKSWIKTTDDQRLGRGLTMDHVDGFSGFDDLPDYAFAKQEDRATFERLVTAFRTSDSVRADDSPEFKALDDELLRVATESRDADPVAWYLTLPAIRSWSLWFHPDNVGLVSATYAKRVLPTNLIGELREHGMKRGAKRLGRGALSAFAVLIHACFPIGLCWAAFLAIKKRETLVLTMLVGIVLYTYTSGLWAAFEFRRNLVFLPWVAFAFVVARHGWKETEPVRV